MLTAASLLWACALPAHTYVLAGLYPLLILLPSLDKVLKSARQLPTAFFVPPVLVITYFSHQTLVVMCIILNIKLQLDYI